MGRETFEPTGNEPASFAQELIATHGFDILDFSGNQLDFDVRMQIQTQAERHGISPALFTRALGFPSIRLIDIATFSPHELEDMVNSFEDHGGMILLGS